MRLLFSLFLIISTTSVVAAHDKQDAVSFSQEDNSEEMSIFRDFMSGIERYNGWGDLPQDYPEAMIFFEKAAKQGHKQSQHYLGLMFYKGLGVEKDNIEAYKWFDLSSSNGDKVGLVLKLTLQDILTDAEISEAESRREEFLHKMTTK